MIFFNKTMSQRQPSKKKINNSIQRNRHKGTTGFILYIDYIDIRTNKLFSYVARTTNMYFRAGK